MRNINKNLSTRDIIFYAAVELFSQKGYHGTSIRDITRKVGIKESSLYNHFQGKESILQAILDYQMSEFSKAVDALELLKASNTNKTKDPVEFWMAGTEVFIKNISPLTESISQIIINEMFFNADCRKFYLNVMRKSEMELVTTLFNVMKEKEMIDDCDIEKTASQYIYMLQGLEIENKLKILEGETPEKVRKNLFEHITMFIKRLKK
ncbi:MAG: TetR/AcrR family transcriptional regulator [Spirochaetes bacterium]|nr:TetR/AcrR family transcriptional regulator [Spirochaetota bacterium]